MQYTFVMTTMTRPLISNVSRAKQKNVVRKFAIRNSNFEIFKLHTFLITPITRPIISNASRIMG